MVNDLTLATICSNHPAIVPEEVEVGQRVKVKPDSKRGNPRRCPSKGFSNCSVLRSYKEKKTTNGCM